jgi:hypothetical protein
MILRIVSTNEITEISGVRMRVWRGVTPGGIQCTLFVHRIAVHDSQDAAEFDRELSVQLPPAEYFVPLRGILP